MTFGSDSGYIDVNSCSLFMYTVSVKPRGCNVLSCNYAFFL